MSEAPAAVLKVDGVSYRFEPGEVTARLELELYRVTGFNLGDLIDSLRTRPATYHIAALVWLSRRISGHIVEFDDVADAITLTSEFELTVDGDDAGDDSPEAPAAD